MKRFFSIFLAIAILFEFCSCAHESEAGDYKIVASFYPVYIFTLNLIDSVDRVSLRNLTDNAGACLHDYQLSVNDMKLLQDSQMLVINGAGMEESMEKLLERQKELNIVDSSEGIKLIIEEHEDAHEGEEHSAHDGHNHEVNSHIWMSVPNAIKQVNNISAALCRALPEKAARIKANEAAYTQKLLGLHNEIISSVSAFSSPVITFHSSYAYFSKEYSLNVVATVETEDGREPTAKELAKTKDIITNYKVKTLLVEPDYSGSSAEILASETDAEIFTVNPVIKGDKSKDSYERIMRENLSFLMKN